MDTGGATPSRRTGLGVLSRPVQPSPIRRRGIAYLAEVSRIPACRSIKSRGATNKRSSAIPRPWVKACALFRPRRPAIRGPTFVSSGVFWRGWAYVRPTCKTHAWVLHIHGKDVKNSIANHRTRPLRRHLHICICMLSLALNSRLPVRQYWPVRAIRWLRLATGTL